MRSISGVLLASLVLLVSGCGSSEPWQKVYPAEGQILKGGKPLAGVEVVLHPKDASFPVSIRPNATTDADGKFKLGTFGTGDGAPAGDYNVTVVQFPLVKSASGPFRGSNALPKKFAVPETSGLQVTVAAKPTTLEPLEIR